HAAEHATGVFDHERAATTLADVRDRAVERAQRKTECGPGEPDPARMRNDEARRISVRRPQQVERQRRAFAGEAKTDGVRARPNLRRPPRRKRQIAQTTEKPRRSTTELEAEARMFEVAASMPKARHSAGQVEWKAQIR